MSVFEEKFSEAIEFVKKSGMESPNKPLIPHALRVGEFLYEKGMSDDVVTAGLLHDLLEWSDIMHGEIKEKFGTYVVTLIEANTKDRNIEDKTLRRKAQIEKCLNIGDDALAIKIADNYDSFKYYSEMENESELERCRDWARLLQKHMSEKLYKMFGDDIENILT